MTDACKPYMIVKHGMNAAKKTNPDFKEFLNAVLYQWRQIVHQYLMLSLTKASDRLPVLRGCSMHWAKVTIAVAQYTADWLQYRNLKIIQASSLLPIHTKKKIDFHL